MTAKNAAARLFAFGLALLWAGSCWAAYPDHPVKVIVPFAPGGPTDVMARLLAQKLSERFNQQFYVENHPGAGGNIGMLMVARATPDGYTILVASSSYTVNPSLYAGKPFDPYKDFEPVTLAAAAPNVLSVHPSVAAKSVKELIGLIAANPGKYSIANAGIGTTPQLAAELFKLSFKLDATSIPFNGAGPAIQSTIANQTPIVFSSMPPAAPQVKGGYLRALAVTATKRSAALPDVPTMAEAGAEGEESETMQGVLVPAGTPRDIVELLNREIVKAMALPDVQAKCADLGFDIVADTPAQFAVYIKNDVEKWDKLIHDAKIPQIQ
jgi:tripartite-type tricarboxylate transporter receptor subunit TctC